MECNFTHFNSVFSFRPLINTWTRLAAGGREGSRQIYHDLLELIQGYPELVQPSIDPATIRKHQLVIERIMATIFPVTVTDSTDIYGALEPFGSNIVYGSEQFIQLFAEDNQSEIHMPELHNAG
ncbi:MAG: hypothetical protein EOO01_27530, partial [Chitinophagaceae bacterium]